MGNLLFRMLSDYFMFSLIESKIFCFYYEKIGNCSKFKFWEVLIIGLVNCILSQTIPPILYQFVMTIWMGCYLYLFKNKNLTTGLLFSTSSMILMLVVEMAVAIFYLNIFKFDFLELNNIELFLTSIPIKILEMLLILGGDKLKAWYGDIEKRK